MKSWTLKFKAVDRKNFDEVKDGSKTIETRAATIKYQPVKVGDELVFVCGKEKLSKSVTKIEHYKSIDEMIKRIPFNKIMPSVKSVEEMKKAYSSYSGYDAKIQDFGLFAFYLN